MSRTIAPLAALAVALALVGCEKVTAKLAALRSHVGADASEAVDAGPPAPVDAGVAQATPPPPIDDGLRHATVELNGPLEKALAGKVDPGVAPALALVMTRITLWWMDPADARKGDVITALYELPAGHEPLVRALHYKSQKFGKEYAAYYYQAPGSKFGRYYGADGTELEERLRNAPIEGYEQVTSFLRDGRKHKGVDFKCPMETPVLMPFDGELTKKNWNWHGNGNCLEFVDAKTGRHAKFLHLSPLPNSLKPGQHFKTGQQVALSGNTGHTTAPHLHYQLEDSSGRILDPFKVHETYRVKLEAAQLPGLESEMSRLDKRLAEP